MLARYARRPPGRRGSRRGTLERQCSTGYRFYLTARRPRPTGATDLAHWRSLPAGRAKQATSDATSRGSRRARSVPSRDPSRNDAAAQVLSASLLAQHRLEMRPGDRARHCTAQPRRSVAPRRRPVRSDGAGAVRLGACGVRQPRVCARPLGSSTSRAGRDRGRTGEALAHARALKTTLATPHLPREQVAWFWLPQRRLDLRSGKYAGQFRVPRRARRIRRLSASRRDGEARRRAARMAGCDRRGERRSPLPDRRRSAC